MPEDARVMDGPGGAPAKMETEPREAHAKQRTACRDAEPLLVELAWLVIEGAVLFRRMRGILARI